MDKIAIKMEKRKMTKPEKWTKLEKLKNRGNNGQNKI